MLSGRLRLDRARQRRQFLRQSLAASTALAAPALLHAATEATPAALHALADGFVDQLMDHNPMAASGYGIASEAQAARLSFDIAPAERSRWAGQCRATLAALERIDRGALSPEDALTAGVLRYQAEDALAECQSPDYLLPINQLDNTLLSMATAAESGLCAFASEADYAQHLQRLRQLPAWCEQALANLREGLRRGIVLPRVLAERSLPQLRQLSVPALAPSPFYRPILQMPAGISASERQRLARAYAQTIDRELRPALRRLQAFWEKHYLPRGRRTAGLCALPGGTAWYEQCVRSGTTTRLSPDEIHQQGLAEVARLQHELRALQATMGHRGSLGEFFAWQRAKPAVRPFRSEREVLDAYAQLNAHISPKLGALFGRAPRTPLEIWPEPALTRDTNSDHYLAPAAATASSSGRNGRFYAVIPDPARYETTGMATLFLHEGQPGHHYQIALSQELPLPRLQRYLDFNAYAEGWALYAETLGFPLGLYEDPDAHLGHLCDAMLRAVRLVVDTGLHAQGWSRERAIAYMVETTGYSPRDARAQIERYMVWPGQALGYAVGRMRIEALREQTKADLGTRFRLADFHDQLLGSGALPLDLLDGKIRRWAASA